MRRIVSERISIVVLGKLPRGESYRTVLILVLSDTMRIFMLRAKWKILFTSLVHWRGPLHVKSWG
jgi:hypothetical protein